MTASMGGVRLTGTVTAFLRTTRLYHRAREPLTPSPCPLTHGHRLTLRQVRLHRGAAQVRWPTAPTRPNRRCRLTRRSVRPQGRVLRGHAPPERDARNRTTRRSP